MSEQVAFALRNRNPDVLNCIANLSNDEVFTPPELANQMLDLLARVWADSHGGADIWQDSTLRFLDPFTKSGVFLREITKRLVAGLENEIPDLGERVDHILTKQVYGIGITRLTSLLARRSLYCSKWANGEHSIARSFAGEDGNVWFQPEDHTWVGGTERVETANPEGQPIQTVTNGTCKFCGASQKTLDRGADLESHAYTFIHTNDIQARIADIFGEDMQFDVVIGNPPYQLKDGGSGGSAVPIYNKFVEQAKTLDPKYLVMVIPSRWFVGGRGLDGFRARMLGDHRLRVLVDYLRDKDAFPTVNVNGGVCYFLWDRDNPGNCAVATVSAGEERGSFVSRELDEFDVFVRRNEAALVLRKVAALGEPSFDQRVSSLKPFGLRTHFHGEPTKSKATPIKFYGSGRVSWVGRKQIESNLDWVDQWKVLLPRATDGNENYPLPIWDSVGPFVAGPGEACSETYLVAARTPSEEEARRIVAYMRTKFFRFLVSLRKGTQDNKADNFSFVPDLPMTHEWTDAELYSRYSFTKADVNFIDSVIRTMEWPRG